MGRIAVIAVLALLAAPACAQAAFPGQNGTIAFTAENACPPSPCGQDIYTTPPAGSGQVRLTATGNNSSPAWSPDGSKVAFTSVRDGNSEIYVMNADGSGQTRVTTTAAAEHSPAWSPSGGQIAFVRNDAIWTMNADGSGETQLTTGTTADDANPAWSPDGARIAFSRSTGSITSADGIYTISATGGDETQIVSESLSNFPGHPNWAPDGTRIAYAASSECDEDQVCFSIHTIKSDGSDDDVVWFGGIVYSDDPAWSPDGSKIVLRYDGGWGLSAINSDGTGYWDLNVGGPIVAGGGDWQPLQDNTPSTFARPKSATKVHAALVPAHAACTTPNRAHGGALTYDSCAPPNHLSPALTVGVGDGSPAFSRSVGSVVLRALTGDPAGPPDEADMSIATSITNVMHKSDLSDYTGELGVDLSLQLTDKEGPVSQTSVNFTLSATVPCTATASTIDGATCALDTTLEALVPSAITEGSRSTFELGPVKVRDGGDDANADTPADDGLLATQGIFVP